MKKILILFLIPFSAVAQQSNVKICDKDNPARCAGVDSSGNLKITGAGGGGTSSNFGAAFPAAGTASGFKDSGGTLMQPGNLDAAGNIKVNVAAGGGSGGTSSSYGAAFPATGTAVGFTDGTNMQPGRVFDLDTGAGTQLIQGVQLRLAASGGSVEAATLTNPLRFDPTGTTAQPVSGTVAVSTAFLLDATFTGRINTLGQKAMAASTPVVLASDQSAVPVSGTVAVSNSFLLDTTFTNRIPAALDADGGLKVHVQNGSSGGTSSNFGAAFPTAGTAIGFKDSAGTNMASGNLDASGNLKVNVAAGSAAGVAAYEQPGGTDQEARVYDSDTGAGTEWTVGTILRKSASGGSVEIGTATDPVRTDPTGTTTQPVSGTVAVSTAFLLDTTFTNRINTLGQKTMANSTPVVIASDQSTLPISAASLPLPTGAATEATLGTLLLNTTFTSRIAIFDVDSGAGTQNVQGVVLRKSASGGSVELGTSTDPVRTDPTGTTPQPVSGTVALSNSFLLDATFTGRINTQGQKTMAASTPVVLASDQSAINIGTFPDNEPINVSQVGGTATTADNATAGTTNIHVLPGIVETSATPPTSTDGNRAALALDSDRKVYVRTYDWDPLFATSGLSTATTLTQLIAAPGAGVSVYVTGWKCSSSAAATTTTDQQCTIKFGTGTNCGTGTTYIDGCFQTANGGCAESMPNPLKITANNALCWIHAAAGSKIVRVNYFLAP